MIEVRVAHLGVDQATKSPVVLLREKDGERVLPIWIGPAEASAIAMELQGADSPRPLPYDLMRSMLTELRGSVEHVVVNDLSMDVFYARIVVAIDGRTIELDSRPSDAIALAVRFVPDAVLAECRGRAQEKMVSSKVNWVLLAALWAALAAAGVALHI